MFSILIIENLALFPVLDYSKNPIGDRYPIKLFNLEQEARAYCNANGYRYFIISPISSAREHASF